MLSLSVGRDTTEGLGEPQFAALSVGQTICHCAQNVHLRRCSNANLADRQHNWLAHFICVCRIFSTKFGSTTELRRNQPEVGQLPLISTLGGSPICWAQTPSPRCVRSESWAFVLVCCPGAPLRHVVIVGGRFKIDQNHHSLLWRSKGGGYVPLDE